MSEELENAVVELMSEESFDVLEFVRGAILPVDKVKIFTDADAAVKVARLVAQQEEYAEREREAIKRGEVAGIDADYGYVDEDEIDALANRLEDSAIIVHIRGLAPKLRRAVEKNIEATHSLKEDPEDYYKALNHRIIAQSVTGVERQGKLYPAKWDDAFVADFEEELYEVEFNKLIVATGAVTYIADQFDAAVTPDFS